MKYKFIYESDDRGFELSVSADIDIYDFMNELRVFMLATGWTPSVIREGGKSLTESIRWEIEDAKE